MLDLEVFEVWVHKTANPERARIGLSGWLQATGNPSLYADQLLNIGEFAQAFLNLLGASQAMCDLLIQNPELPTLYLEEPEPYRLPSLEESLVQGRMLLESSTSHQHSMDRLRYLKQRKLFRIALVDVNNWQEPPKVWNALSDLADAILELALTATWDYHLRMRVIDPFPCPVNVIAFGKHGGREVNYSSDLDLVFVLEDGLEEKAERETLRFCELYIKSLTDRMGRGALYRIDMRLRPYGGAGELAKSMRATEAYYKLYAEPWEAQALIRSRLVVGSIGMKERWEHMRKQNSFKAHVSEFTTDSILETRERIDAFAEDADFKRARGGIRDIEFTVQTLQLVHGHRDESLQVQGTLDALENLRGFGLIGGPESKVFQDNYQWLRQLEHRCQLLHDQQTHQLPVSEDELNTVQHLVRSRDVVRELQSRRDEVANVYYRFNHSTKHAEASFDLGIACTFLGNHIDAETLGASLRENEGSLRRLSFVMENAPLFQGAFQADWSLGEALLSGEIEEMDTYRSGVTVEQLRFERAALFSRWVLNRNFDVQSIWSKIALTTLQGSMQKAGIPSGLSAIALGSAGFGEMFPGSDIDLVFVAENEQVQRESEIWIPKFLADWNRTGQTHGNPVAIDLRLRPEGKKGLLARTQGAFRQYAREDMEPWEHYMLGFSQSDAFGWLCELPWDAEHETELMAIKARVENERLNEDSKMRDVKVGLGAMMDIQWLARLDSLRKQTSLIHPLGENLKLIDLSGTLESAYRFFSDLRVLLQLRKNGDLLPVEDAAMNALALQMGLPNGEALWQKNLQMRHNVREIYEPIVKQL